jgi:cytochrome c oxidase cbb3-type subunit 1
MMNSSNAAIAAETYNDTVVRQFGIMTEVWGIVGMLVSVIVAADNLPWFS